MPAVSLEAVTKVFQGGAVAVDDLSLEIDDGEFMILVGSSGCGKTTALRMIAGLETPTTGTIRIGERVVNDVSPKDRDIAMVFQNYALYPHMTVARNLAYPLRQRRDRRGPRSTAGSARSREMLGLEELLKRRPAQLSGGQRQRVAMGRALVREPEVFLLDEPLSNLDAKLRVQMRAELKRLHGRLGVTTRLRDPRPGRGDDARPPDRGPVGGPAAATGHRRRRSTTAPSNVFVAGFIGSPPMNLLRARARDGRVTAGDFTLARGAAGRRADRRASVPSRCSRPARECPASICASPSSSRSATKSIVHGLVSAELLGGDADEATIVADEGPRATLVVRLPPRQRPADEGR